MGAVLQMVLPQEDYFEEFWTLVWRKEAKKDTRLAWSKINPRDHIKIVVATAAWRPIYLARDTEFRPLPATWLRGERYEDELPTGATGAAHSSHVMATMPTLPERAEIPEHVKALLAKLKRG